MSTIDNYLINGDYPDEWPEDACDLVDILREHETRYIVRVAVLEAKLEAMERLWEYANHKESCWLETGPFGKAGEDHVCTCGYDDLLRAAAQEEGE